MKQDALLTTKQASELLNISVATLERDRWMGAKIPFVKFDHAVRYRLEDINEFIENSLRVSTTDKGQGA